MLRILRYAPVMMFLAGTALGAAPSSQAPAEKDVASSGFAGTWALAATADDVARVAPANAWGGLGGTTGATARPGGGGFDLPIEVMTDARLLVVEDDGLRLRVTYPSGRVRTFVTDGSKRYVDDGDGPADVVARRRDRTVTVSSEWVRGYRLRETWELRTDPHRLVVTGRLKGRESHEYVRNYEPAPEGAVAASATPPPPAPTPAVRLPWAPSVPASTPAPAPEEPGGSPAKEPSSVDRLSECTLRPPARTPPGALNGLAKTPQETAAKAAAASVAPLRADGVLSSDAEVFDGCLVWPFTLRLPALGGVQEVFVDAGDGRVVKSDFIRLGPRPAGAP
ncbi:MAG TPA: hypothetical protein PLP50_04525 [Thermoanaerobaculia bacterium]|nr:hypothetical protein [Thermoanaerobaculia bacterium]HQN08877.1 hypothetical protein [Thermoanaerobaculia bacterium]HQP86037.1 hypothetical protein [Thermoanaerobaculia bacterium]